jgi:hypothetical protein
MVGQWSLGRLLRERWEDLDGLLADRVVPALPVYNQLLARPFDPSVDTERITMSLAD